jgi:twitching motility protein PilT
VGSDTQNFTDALRRLLRQDPDVVLIGEMRDLETIRMALTIAETGHLVFGTLHTNNAVQTINRIINVFPAGEQSQIRQLLSFVLQGIIAQQLVPKSYEKGRICAQEILFANPSIRNLIREEKVHQVYSAMQVGQEKSGMKTMNQCLLEYVEKGIIKSEAAVEYSPEPEELARTLQIERKYA